MEPHVTPPNTTEEEPSAATAPAQLSSSRSAEHNGKTLGKAAFVLGWVAMLSPFAIYLLFLAAILFPRLMQTYAWTVPFLISLSAGVTAIILGTKSRMRLKAKNGRALAGIILSVAAIVLTYLFFYFFVFINPLFLIPLPAGIIGIILGVKSRERAKAKKSWALAGMILSVAAVVLSYLFFLYLSSIQKYY